MNRESAVPGRLDYRGALLAILGDCEGRSTPGTTVPLEEAVGSALAATLISPVSVPLWDNSAMDGYAVRSEDVLGATEQTPRTLVVSGMSVAGSCMNELVPVGTGCAMKIMTGAPIPPDANAVIRVEDTCEVTTEDSGTALVSVLNDRDARGRGNIRRQGEDVEAGTEVLLAGTTIRSAHLGLLASTGFADVFVHRAPRVTIISSGDELVSVEEFAKAEHEGRIVASSSYALPPLLKSAGANVTMMPLVRDSLDALVSSISTALEGDCDLLITTGGISVGAHDYTREALSTLGGTQSFWRAKIRPGGPLGSGNVRGVPWIGLPGNPVSTLVTAILFAWPLIRRLGGHSRIHHVPLPVRVMSEFSTPAPLTHFMRVTVSAGTDGQLEAHSVGAQGSHLQTGMTLADALLVIPEELDCVEPGTMLSAILLPDDAFLKQDFAPTLKSVIRESSHSGSRVAQ